MKGEKSMGVLKGTSSDGRIIWDGSGLGRVSGEFQGCDGLLYRNGETQMIKNGKMAEMVYRISIKDIYGVKHDIIVNEAEMRKLTENNNEEETK